MPPQFSALGQQMNESWVESLTYQGADGRMIVRPPGLTDQPGGAATAGAIAAVLGLGLTLLQQQSRARYLPIAGTLLGLTALYLTQVRSLLLMCLGAFAMMAALSLRRGRVRAAAWLVGSGGALGPQASYGPPPSAASRSSCATRISPRREPCRRFARTAATSCPTRSASCSTTRLEPAWGVGG